MNIAGQQLWLVRHGETEWSRLGRHTGRTDLALLPAGEGQARALAPILATQAFARVYSSPLRRALDTCRLAGLAKDAELTNDLLEWDYGTLEGRTSGEIRGETPEWSVWTHPVPGGESLADVATRACRMIDRAVQHEGPVVLFAHGHILRVLAATWLELPPQAGQRFALETGSISVLGYEHEWRVIQRWSVTAAAVGSSARR